MPAPFKLPLCGYEVSLNFAFAVYEGNYSHRIRSFPCELNTCGLLAIPTRDAMDRPHKVVNSHQMCTTQLSRKLPTKLNIVNYDDARKLWLNHHVLFISKSREFG